MHDISELEKRGLPALFIASDEFRSAASAQAEALGFEPSGVFVKHPIQGQTDAEIEELARGAIGEILGRMTG